MPADSREWEYNSEQNMWNPALVEFSFGEADNKQIEYMAYSVEVRDREDRCGWKLAWWYKFSWKGYQSEALREMRGEPHGHRGAFRERNI